MQFSNRHHQIQLAAGQFRLDRGQLTGFDEKVRIIDIDESGHGLPTWWRVQVACSYIFSLSANTMLDMMLINMTPAEKTATAFLFVWVILLAF
jgi:hypothetical protein